MRTPQVLKTEKSSLNVPGPLCRGEAVEGAQGKAVRTHRLCPEQTPRGPESPVHPCPRFSVSPVSTILCVTHIRTSPCHPHPHISVSPMSMLLCVTRVHASLCHTHPRFSVSPESTSLCICCLFPAAAPAAAALSPLSEPLPAAVEKDHDQE